MTYVCNPSPWLAETEGPNILESKASLNYIVCSMPVRGTW